MTDEVSFITRALRAQLDAAAVADAGLVAEELVAAVVKRPRLELALHGDLRLSAEERVQLQQYANQAVDHTPLQYILGYTDFMGLRLRCDRRALIPRPETEQLVERVLADAHLRSLSQPVLIDVGSGTGCIGLSLAHAWPHARVVAIEREPAALSLAVENAVALELTGRVTFLQADLLEGQPVASADAVVANLPYVPSADCATLEPRVGSYEPWQALDGGPDGLDEIMRLIESATVVLRSRGRIFLEMGMEQGSRIAAGLRQAGFDAVQIQPDWLQRDRFAIGVRP